VGRGEARVIEAPAFLAAARAVGFRLYTGVPCSYLQPLINCAIDDADARYVGATNEGDAVAIASGAEIGGVRSIVMFQNSGLGNAVSPLSSLNAIFRLPVLVIATLRGEPGGPADEPQHALMGTITTSLFDQLRIPWEHFPTDATEIAPCLARATAHMDRERTPYGVVMKKGSVAAHALGTPAPAHSVIGAAPMLPQWSKTLPSRADVLRAVQAAVQMSEGESDAIVATTGYTGRELYALDDRKNQLYMVGSMGCASPFALGVAIARPQRRVVVLDGDGAMLMRMGALGTIGYERPENLVHVVLDNESYESTGGQSTVSHATDLAMVAHACGYPRVLRATSAREVSAALAHDAPRELTFVHVKIASGVPENLPRPKVGPVDVGERFRSFLTERASATRSRSNERA
jgi:phosphonopyruvate decarboxylase